MDELEKQLLQGALASRQLSDISLNPQRGGLSRLVGTFRARRQANRNADLVEALKQQEEQTRSRIIGQLSPEQRPLAEEVDTDILKKLVAKRLESSFEAPTPLSPEGKREADVRAGLLSPSARTDVFETEFQKAKAREQGKQKATDIEKLQSIESNLPELQKRVSELKEIGSRATFTRLGTAKDFLSKEFRKKSTEGGKAKVEFMAKVDQTILPLLKQTFPGAISDDELKALRNTLGSATSSPEEKNLVLDAFIQQKIDDTKGLRRKLGVPQRQQPAQQKTQQTAVQPQIQEGQTAINPSTGERIIFRGGQWQKI